MSPNLIPFLEHQALNIRIDAIRATTAGGSGHPTSCLSAADIIAVIFFHVLKHDYNNPKAINNDRLVMSKGHAIPVVYAALKNLRIISDDELLSLRKFDSVLEGHPTPRFVHNEAATGSLGQGLSIGVGMALNAKHDKLSYKTYVMMGDAEIAEGSVWEAAELANHYKLDNLIGIVDCNRLGQSEPVLEDHHVERYAKRFEAFGWKTIIIDGHNMADIIKVLDQAQHIKNQPTMIIAKTFKGHGVSTVENKNGFHGKPFTHDEMQHAIKELQTTFKKAYEFQGTSHEAPTLPENNRLPEPPEEIKLNLPTDPNNKYFALHEKLATRKAYGYALAALGRKSDKVFALDGDVKNSTFSEIFEKEFPDRFFQCFVAEQNMVGTATGLESRGKIPFPSTFACFLTRAHDQIRMAGIGRNALRLCGSHAGVSIGEDGPSQMGLEDISLMRAIPNSVVLYPSDGVSAYKLMQAMANYHDGISYLRTTRSATPNIYDMKEEFSIGGCKVVHQSSQDVACIVGAGITLHEALKAYKLLKDQGVMVSVIDLYSVKPLDIKTIKEVVKKSHHRLVTVEDHYLEGGLGEAIAHNLNPIHDFDEQAEPVEVKILAVEQISRSGAPEELLAYAGIDTASIVNAVLSML